MGFRKTVNKYRIILVAAALFILSVLSYSASASIINSTHADGIIIYEQKNDASPRYRLWDEIDFGSEGNATSVGLGTFTDITWSVAKASHKRDEIIIGTLDKSNDINIQIYNSSGNWTNILEVTDSAENSGQRGFDIEYEDLSGDALIVYENSNSNDNNDFAYRIWNGTNYSDEIMVETGLGNDEFRWLSLIPNKETDKMMLLIMNDGNDLYAMPWNGTDFVSSLGYTLTTGATSDSEQHFDFAWEESSGQGIVVYGEGNDLVWRTYDPAGGFGAVENTIALGNGLDATRLCSDPNSDHIGMIWQDNGNDVFARIWDGTQILSNPPTEETQTESNGGNNANLDCIWINSTTAIFGFTDNNALSIDYFTFTKGNTWSTADLESTDNSGDFAADDVRGMRFIEHPTEEEFMVITQDIDEYVTAIRWNGSSFVAPATSTIETLTEVSDGGQESAMFAYYKFNPPPNVTSINPQTINFAINSTISINSTVIDNINVSTVLANITLPDNTIQQITLTDHNSDNIYNSTFTNTSQRGYYIIKIIANDTSYRNNINSTETVNFSVGDVFSPNITILTPSADQIFNLSSNITIQVNATDDTNISYVLANITYPNSTVEQYNMSFTGTIYELNFTNTNILGTHTITIIANDTAGNTNSTETLNFILGDGTNPVVQDITPSEGTNYSLNDEINITANITDNINISTVLVNITLPNSTVQQLIMTDPENDSIFNVTFTNTANKGHYNITIIANDTANNINSSEITYFIAGDIISPTTTLNSPINNLNTSDTTIIFNFTSTDETSSTLNCSLILDSVKNQTNTSVHNSTLTTFTITNLPNGEHNWSINCTDSAGNSNITETLKFTVDLYNVTFISLITDPNSTDNIDPNVNITATANVTDNITSVDTVILQYRLSNETAYTNITMTLGADGLYNATFNATQTGIYILRLKANDTVNNTAISNSINITAELESTWTRTPSSMVPVNANTSQNISIGNITINNTGDYPLNFTITSDSTATAFNETENFTLAANQVKTLIVNDTAPLGGVKVITLTITSNGTPSSQTTTGTIVAEPGKPVLYTTFTTPSGDTKTVVQGQTAVAFIAKVENIGQGNSTNVSSFINLPSGWLISFGENTTVIDELNAGESEEVAIEVNIPSDAGGDYTITANSTGYNTSGSDLSSSGLIFGDSVTITVEAPSENLGTITPTTESSSRSTSVVVAGSSSSSSGGSAILAKAIDTILSGEEILTSSETFELVRGETDSFPITIKNIFQNTTLRNISIKIEGYLSQYIETSPENIGSITFNETKNFDARITSPEYMEKGSHDLKIIIVGNIISKETNKELIDTREVELIIHTVSKETASKILDYAIKDIKEMEALGFPVYRISKLMGDAKRALDSHDYETAELISKEIRSMKQKAVEADSLLKDLREKTKNIMDSFKGGVEGTNMITGAVVSTIPKRFTDTIELLNLAQASFEREDYETALQRLGQARLTLALEKGEFNLFLFLIEYWWLILLSSIFLSVTGTVSYQSYSKAVISQRLRSLGKKEDALREDMKDTQSRYFKEKFTGLGTFRNLMVEYQKRLSKIRQVKTKLRHKRIRILKPEKLIINLEEERKEITHLIKSLQTDYFKKGNISKKEYKEQSKLYYERVAEIEDELLTSQIQAYVKKE